MNLPDTMQIIKDANQQLARDAVTSSRLVIRSAVACNVQVEAQLQVLLRDCATNTRRVSIAYFSDAAEGRMIELADKYETHELNLAAAIAAASKGLEKVLDEQSEAKIRSTLHPIHRRRAYTNNNN
jgi:hypothetical protein